MAASERQEDVMGFWEDVTQPVRSVGEAFLSFGQSVTGAVGDVAQGGGLAAIGEKASKRLNTALAASGTMATGGLLESRVYQDIGDNKLVDTVTLGLSGDAAGFGRLTRDVRYTGEYSQEDLDDTIRGAGKLAVAGIGAAAVGYAGAGSGASSVGWGSASIGGVSGTDALLAANIADRARRGDIVGIGQAIGSQYGDPFSEYLPQFPTMPDWLSNVGNDIARGLTGSSPRGVPGPTVTEPYQYMDGGLATQESSKILPILLVLGAGIATYFVVRRLSK